MTLQKQMDELTADECLRLLDDHTFGRLAFMDHVGVLPMIVPLNYVLHDDRITFRTGAGSKLGTALRGEPVAFEVDGLRFGRQDWLECPRARTRGSGDRHPGASRALGNATAALGTRSQALLRAYRAPADLRPAYPSASATDAGGLLVGLGPTPGRVRRDVSLIGPQVGPIFRLAWDIRLCTTNPLGRTMVVCVKGGESDDRPGLDALAGDGRI